MSRRTFYPYPRLPLCAVEWAEWNCEIDGRAIVADKIKDQWDSASAIVIATNVKVDRTGMLQLGKDSPELIVTVSCPDTALTLASSSDFATGGSVLHSSAHVVLSGDAISTRLDVKAQIVLSRERASAGREWLSRRIIAEAPRMVIPLESEITAFPTSSQSFKAANRPEVPWEIHVTADDPSDTFTNSVVLVLNEDYPLVRELIAGHPRPHVEAELNSSIVRVLIHEAARLSVTDGCESLDSAATEHPYSVAAAAQRAALQYLKSDLTAAVSMVRWKPGQFESRLAEGTALLREKP